LLPTSSQTVDALSDITIPELIERLSGAIEDFIDDISSRLLDIDLKNNLLNKYKLIYIQLHKIRNFTV